ncbi:MAG: efflux RND transporter periplasmic adaptor subunit [Nitrospinota bacterium]
MNKNSLAGGFSVLIFLLFQAGCSDHESSSPLTPPISFTEKVAVKKVSKETIPLFYEAVGTIKARTSVILSSKIAGHIKSIRVTEGRRVQAGQTLIEIDSREVKAKLRQAQAGLESAKKQLDEVNTGISQAKTRKKQAEAELSLAETTFSRFKKLHKEKAVSDQQFDSARAALRVAEEVVNGASQKIDELVSKKERSKATIEKASSSVEEVKVMKSFSIIKAPFNGVIVQKYMDVGSLASPGAPLLSLENPEGFRLEINVREEEFASRVTLGKKVDVFLDAFGKRRIKGEVAEIVPTANSLSRTFKVKISLPVFDGIKSGMYGKAIYSRGERKGILIPKTSLIKRGQLEQVFTVDKESIARLRLVKAGKEFGEKVEVLSGLAEGDLLVSAFKAGLKEGYTVEVSQ